MAIISASQQKLMDAAQSGDLVALKASLAAGVDPKNNECRAIRIAGKEGHLEVFKHLHELGAYHAAAVCWAALNGHDTIVEYMEGQPVPKGQEGVLAAQVSAWRKKRAIKQVVDAATGGDAVVLQTKLEALAAHTLTEGEQVQLDATIKRLQAKATREAAFKAQLEELEFDSLSDEQKVILGTALKKLAAPK